jgi:ankyrin repeat protein
MRGAAAEFIGTFALMFAGTGEIVALLLAKKADVDAQDNGGWTPLHMAARSGCKEVVQILVANKAKVDVKDNNSVTPLSRAMMQGHREVVELLRLYGGRA